MDIPVGLAAWRYETRDEAKEAKERAEAALGGIGEAGVAVYAALRGDEDEGWVAIVGPPDKVDEKAEAWDPGGGERGELRDDLGVRMALAFLQEARGIVLEGDSYTAAPGLAEWFEMRQADEGADG